MRRRSFVRLGTISILAPGALGFFPGCGPGTVAEPSSPVVSPDSEAAKKARAEDEKLKEQRRQEEARFRKRVKNLPDEG